MKFSVLLATCGKGCEGSSPIGTSSGCAMLAKEAGDPLALLGGAVGMVEDEDARLAQGRRYVLIEDLILILDQLVRLLDHLGDVLPVDVTGPCARDLQHVGMAHAEGLGVEVGRHDADVAQPLEQRDILRWACAKTRRLNARMACSRLNNFKRVFSDT